MILCLYLCFPNDHRHSKWFDVYFLIQSRDGFEGRVMKVETVCEGKYFNHNMIVITAAILGKTEQKSGGEIPTWKSTRLPFAKITRFQERGLRQCIVTKRRNTDIGLFLQPGKASGMEKNKNKVHVVLCSSILVQWNESYLPRCGSVVYSPSSQIPTLLKNRGSCQAGHPAKPRVILFHCPHSGIYKKGIFLHRSTI